MVKPAGKRKVVDFLKTDKNFSQSRSCRLVKLDVSTYKYQSVKRNDNELRDKIVYLANHKKVYRIYKEEKLAVQRKKRKQKLKRACSIILASFSNEMWSMDFVSDSLAHVNDVLTRECLAIEADFSLQ